MKPNHFQAYVEAQLEDIEGLKFKRMFGGFGLYAGELFFGILNRERLYFRINEQTKKRYENAGMDVFITPARKKALKNYYEVPLAVIEQRSDLAEWAREAVAAAKSAD